MAKKLLRIFLGFILLYFFNAQVGFTQPSEELKDLKSQIEFLRREIEGLRGRQITIQKEFEEIKKLLRERQVLPQPQPQQKEVFLSVEDAFFKGDKNAKLTLIEFSDYQCPFCGRHFRETLPQIEKEYIDTGKIKYVFKDFPISSIHREAFKAAEATHCAAEQGKYWEMHDRLFGDQSALGFKDLSLHAEGIGLDLEKFDRCLIPGKQASKIHKDIAEGLKAGIKGTPTFFLGLTDPNDTKIKALKVITGAQSYATFKEAIESLLSTQK